MSAGPMFLQGDIRELIAFSPPPLALFRASHANDRLLRTDAARRAFNDLIQTSTRLIPIDTLPKCLDLQHVGWLLDELPRPVISLDGSSIVPRPVLQDIAARLIERARTSFIDLSAEELNVSIHDLEKSLGQEAMITTVNAHVYASSRTLLENAKTRLLGLMTEFSQQAKVVNLSTSLSHVPLPLIHFLATTIIDASSSALNGVLDDSNGTLSFQPSSQSQPERQDQKITALLEHIKVKGWCDVAYHDHTRSDAVVNAILGRSGQSATDQPVELIPAGSNSTVLVMPSILKHRLAYLEAQARKLADGTWTRRETDKDSMSAATLLQSSDRRDLDTHVLASDQGRPVFNVYAERMQQLRSTTEREFEKVVQRNLVNQPRLYANGLKATKTDEALSYRTSEHVTIYIKTEIIAPTIAQLHKDKTVPSKAAQVELERLTSGLSEAKDAEQILGAVRRLTRRLKLGTTDLNETKSKVLDAKLAVMERIKRPSDLLQHATWILLACLDVHADCLFVTSGKDTSRMIRLYASLVREHEAETRHADWTGRLETLRDVVKAGSDVEQSRDQLRRLAREAVQERKTKNGT